MTLYINTILPGKILVAVAEKEETLALKEVKVEKKQAEKLLLAVNAVLKKAKLELKAIKKIVVADEGGSFTSLRVGVLTANALGYALKIPVVAESGRKNRKVFAGFQLVEPRYYGEPNIGRAKK